MWWVAIRWLARMWAKDLVLEYGGRILALVGVCIVMLVAVALWALSIMAQPGGIYWMAAQAPPALQAQHPLVPRTGGAFDPALIGIVVPVPGTIPVGVDVRQPLIAAAMTWLNTPYFWGGCSHSGVDCSCLMMNVFATVGIHIPRTTLGQIAFTRPVAAAQAVATDLVFFDDTCRDCGPNPTHVGLYLGDGIMIDAGDPVQIERVFTGHNARFGRVPM